MKKCILSLLLALALSVSAFAMEVPTETVIRNLNGSQQLIKTYILSPDADPQTLIEAPFELEGYTYTFADIVKEENRVADTDRHTETVTLETTVKAYCLAVSGYMRWYKDIYGEPAGQLCRANLLEHISYLRTERKLANRSVNSKLAALQCYNEFLIQTGIQKDLILSKRDYLKVQTAYANPSTVSRE